MRIASGCFILAGIVLGVIRQVGASPAETGLEGMLASMAFGMVIAAPGIVALVAKKPLFILAAGMAGAVISLLASFGLTLILLLPSAVLITKGFRVAYRRAQPGNGVTAGAVMFLLMGALLSLLFTENPREWSDATGGGSVSDVIVVAESLLSLFLVGLAITLAVLNRAEVTGKAEPAAVSEV